MGVTMQTDIAFAARCIADGKACYVAGYTADYSDLLWPRGCARNNRARVLWLVGYRCAAKAAGTIQVQS